VQHNLSKWTLNLKPVVAVPISVLSNALTENSWKPSQGRHFIWCSTLSVYPFRIHWSDDFSHITILRMWTRTLYVKTRVASYTIQYLCMLALKLCKVSTKLDENLTSIFLDSGHKIKKVCKELDFTPICYFAVCKYSKSVHGLSTTWKLEMALIGEEDNSRKPLSLKISWHCLWRSPLSHAPRDK